MDSLHQEKTRDHPRPLNRIPTAIHSGTLRATMPQTRS